MVERLENIGIKYTENRAWYLICCLYLAIDYARVQDVFSVLKLIRPNLFVSLILLIFVIKNKAFAYNVQQVRYSYYFFALIGGLVLIAVNNYYSYRTFEGLLLFLPFMLSILYCINSIDRLINFLNYLVFIAGYLSCYSTLNLGMGSGGWFGDENDLALFLNTILPISYYLFIFSRTLIKKLFYASSLILSLVGEVISFSRGGFIGLVTVGIVIICQGKNKFRNISIVLTISLIFSIFATQYMEEMKTIQNVQTGTAQERIQSWISGWYMFIDNPIGVGGNNFQVRFAEYQTEYFQRGMWGRVAHSLWVTLLTEAGIIGVIIYIKLILINFKSIADIKNQSEKIAPNEMFHYLGQAYFASIAGFFASSTFLSVLYYPHYWYLSMLIAATIKVKNDKK
jgi:putative inorganic carbon (hco3(-)) transporter